MTSGETPGGELLAAFQRPKVVAVIQLAWVLLLALPTVLGVAWQLRPRVGATVRLDHFSVVGGSRFIIIAAIIALAPTIFALLLAGFRRRQ